MRTLVSALAGLALIGSPLVASARTPERPSTVAKASPRDGHGHRGHQAKPHGRHHGHRHHHVHAKAR